MVGLHVGVAFAAWEGHAVICGDDDERVVQQAAFFEIGNHAPEMAVEMLDFKGVVEHVIADHVVVRPVSGHVVDVGELLASFGDTATEFITAMRLHAAIPEAPWLVGRRGIEEVAEVGRVVAVQDLGRGRLCFALVIGRAGHLAWFAIFIVRHAGAPAFGGVAHVPALLRKGFAPAFELRREVADVVRRFLELP